jgi:hypothetical protein
LRLEYKNTCCKSDSDSPACLNCITMMMSTWCSKHVQAYNKLIIKQEFVH